MYKHILLAVELNTKGDKEPIEKAMELAKKTGAQISILHAIEHISSYGAAYGVAVGADIEEMLLENATKEMRKLGKELKVHEELQVIKFGLAKVVILEEAERLKADMIVVSSTPVRALTSEWHEHDIAKYVRVIAGQEMGKKALHLKLAASGKYPEDRILMIGDAPGGIGHLRYDTDSARCQ